MALIPVLCPSCQQDKVMKRGKTEGGTQRFLCRNPNCATKSFLSEYSYNGSRKEVKEKIIEMTLSGSGIRDISRVLKISTHPVISALRQKCRSVLPAAAASGAGGDNSIFLRLGEQSGLWFWCLRPSHTRC